MSPAEILRMLSGGLRINPLQLGEADACVAGAAALERWELFEEMLAKGMSPASALTVVRMVRQPTEDVTNPEDEE